MFRYPALFAFILALVLRLGYVFYVQQVNPESIYLYDSWGYLNLSQNILSNQTFSQMLVDPFTPDSTRTPLYPAFLVPFFLFKLGGEWIVYIQAILGAITAWVAVKAASLVNRKNIGNVFVGILIAIDLPSIYMSNVVATETVFTLLLVCSIYYAIKGIKFKEEEAIHFSILFMLLATLCRPITLYFAFIIPIFYALNSGFGLFQRAKTLFNHLLLIALVLGPWYYRNYQTFGEPFYSSISEVNLLFHTSTQVRSITENRSQKEIENEYREQSLGHLDFVNEPSSIAPFRHFAREETKRVIQGNKEVFISMWGSSIFYFFAKPMRSYFDVQLYGKNSAPIASVANRNKGNLLSTALNQSSSTVQILIFIQLLSLTLIYLGIVVSLFYWISKDFKIFSILALLVLYLALASSLTEVDARFRVPILPCLAMLSIPFVTYFGKNAEVEIDE